MSNSSSNGMTRRSGCGSLYRKSVRAKRVLLCSHAAGVHRAASAADRFAAAEIPNLSYLFDESKGRGVVSDAWPAPPCSDTRFGYAGGLGPHNIGAQLHAIGASVAEGCGHGHPIWVDMESGCARRTRATLRVFIGPDPPCVCPAACALRPKMAWISLTRRNARLVSRSTRKVRTTKRLVGFRLAPAPSDRPSGTRLVCLVVVMNILVYGCTGILLMA
jgi:hypothetical protein